MAFNKLNVGLVYKVFLVIHAGLAYCIPSGKNNGYIDLGWEKINRKKSLSCLVPQSYKNVTK